MNLHASNGHLEDNYLKESRFPIVKNHYIVISGCSGGGKSTLLAELTNRGYCVVPEPGRQIIREQTAIKGDALPWVDLNKFLEFVLSRYLFQFNSQRESQTPIFFDRGIIDALLLDQSQPEYFQNAANNFRYNRLVFLVPPWKEIYANDAERKHDFEAAKKEYDELLLKYKHFGYETILIPKAPVKERVDFILNKLSVSETKTTSPKSVIELGKRLLEWNKIKLTRDSNLKIEDLSELFAPEFVVIANGKKYDANYKNYFEFLNKFRSDIAAIDYEVEDYIASSSTVIMPLKAIVKRLEGTEDIFHAMLLLKFNNAEKIMLWEEVYTLSSS